MFRRTPLLYVCVGGAGSDEQRMFNVECLTLSVDDLSQISY